jgi:hypothetical protein
VSRHARACSLPNGRGAQSGSTVARSKRWQQAKRCNSGAEAVIAGGVERHRYGRVLSAGTKQAETWHAVLVLGTGWDAVY